MTFDNETEQQRDQSALNYVGEAVIDILHVDINLSYIVDSLADLAGRDLRYTRLAEVANEVKQQVLWLEDEIKRMLGGEIKDSLRDALLRYDALDLYEELLDYGGDRFSALHDEYGKHTGWLLGRIVYRTREAELPDPAALVVNREVLEHLWTGPWEYDSPTEYLDAYIETVKHIKVGYEHEAEWSMADQLGEEPTDDDQIFRVAWVAEWEAMTDMMDEMLRRLGRGPNRDWQQDALRLTRLCRLRDKALCGLEQRRPGMPTDEYALADYRAWVEGTQSFYAELMRDEPNGQAP